MTDGLGKVPGMDKDIEAQLRRKLCPVYLGGRVVANLREVDGPVKETGSARQQLVECVKGESPADLGLILRSLRLGS
jgi:hypothetical protein